MDKTRINAHRLIGESVREPGQERCGRIVGVDQSRATPVVFVIWQEQEGIHRVELTFDELRQLAGACERRDPMSPPADDAATDVSALAEPTDYRRRVGSH
ncbi:hypothetical protein [Salinicola aestuarinus]|uniref:hypothetical protein n=1 Tax=Salinicola aestuarinus TaxID=1949082 RepID=UPI000DA16C69|nr:hypothetical protein [Salinicola aestuarinus]